MAARALGRCRVPRLTERGQELETLLEKGVIDEAIFDQIHAALPEESPLHGPLRTATGNAATASQARSSPAAGGNNGSNSGNGGTPAPPAEAFQNLGINSTSPAPPSYGDTPAPGVPSRNGKPVIAHARALYRYTASDARDVSFERDDRIAVHEHMNQDWWMGQNLRTGQQGIFPCNYVLVDQDQLKGPPPPAVPYAQPQYGYPQGPPPQQNPYNSNVPPMAVAEGGQPPPGEQQQQQQGGSDNKVGEYGKKFGKKLGNAAIFGAGATIGGNIVNSIF